MQEVKNDDRSPEILQVSFMENQFTTIDQGGICYLSNQLEKTSGPRLEKTQDNDIHLLIVKGCRSTSDSRRLCAMPRSLAGGPNKSGCPQLGPKMSLILKGANDPRIRD